MTRTRLFIACIALTITAGCGLDDSSRSPEVAYDSALTTLELMHLVVEPAADVLWDSAGWIMTLEEEYSLVPTDDEGWFAAESAAGIIIESGNLLKLPERSAERAATWIDYSTEMSEQGKLAWQAVLDRDGEALFQVGASLYQSCVQCHDEYWTNR